MARFLIFRAGGKQYALRLQEVAEVMEPRDSFPIPVAPHYFKGVINFHGTLTAVLDLPLFLGSGKGSHAGKFLVLDGRIAALALWVDGVGSIIGEEAILEWRPADDPLLEGGLETEWGEVRLIRVEALLERLEKGVGAASPAENH